MIPLLDLNRIHAPIRDELVEAVVRVVDSGRFILGPEVEGLEAAIAAYCGTRYAVGCASGTDALYLALRAAGVQPGDKVVTTPFTFFATAGAISRAGAVPVFVDIDPRTFNLNPELVAPALRSAGSARAVIPVHLYGGSADMDPILAAARAHGSAVIEDAAQAIGAEYKGRRCGGLGDIGCISFFPSKNLGGLGEGGMVTTGDLSLRNMAALLRVHGSRDKYRHELIGVNSRLDAMQAAALLVKLRHLDAWTARRQENAAIYRECLAGRTPFALPSPAPYQTRHVFNQFVIRSPRRDPLRDYLAKKGIGSEVYYPIPLHLQPCYAGLGYREGDFPESERAAREALALPIHQALTRDEIETVSQAILEFHG
ncbi:MAG: DegT/DnrJ/EryC1/StrS family aminotransferase [Bryobacteraceae bacterium]|nr:DegT/DnrJ/EryC1/StrS family aminotransferase [Bryobacteraceae bacterium]